MLNTKNVASEGFQALPRTIQPRPKYREDAEQEKFCLFK